MMARDAAAGARNPRRAVWIWLACMAIAAWLTARAHYVADLSAFLPTAPTPVQAVLLEQLSSGAASRTVLIGIEGGDAEARAAASLQLGQALRDSGSFSAVLNGDNAAWQAAGDLVFRHRYLLSPAIDAERFGVAGLRAAIDDTVALLGTPAGTLIKPILLRDPTGETVRIGEALLPAQAPRSEGGVWVSRHAPRALLVATTRADGGDLDAQQRSLALLQSAFAPHAAQGLRLQTSGAPVFAVQSRLQIEAEVERLAVAGGVVMIGLLLLAFGSPRALGLALLPVGSGVLAGIAAVSLGFGSVHGITLGFGVTLIGEAVDYGIYYLIQARGPGCAGRWIGVSWPTVRLGLWTSLAGFAALVFSGFPGLAQLGVFSVAGLTAAALTTRWVLPTLAPQGATGNGWRHLLGRATARAARWLPRARTAFVLLALAALLAVIGLPSPWRGDLASLSPVGATALQLDADLRRDLGTADAATFVALSAADEAGALALAEAAGERLDRLVGADALQGYDSPAKLLPSPSQQAARLAALPDAPTLRAHLAQATADGPLKADRLGAFVDDVQAARALPPLHRAALDGTPLASAVDAMLVPGAGGRPWRALLLLHAGPREIDVNAVRQTLVDLPQAQVVSVKPELDALYARYLRQAMLQSWLGAGAVCLLLALHLRSWRRLLRVAQPIAAAVLVVLAGLTASGEPLGILHLVGLLLVVAIGSNYALFFDHFRERGEADDDTLASLALANLTTVASFALLAMSAIPTLHAIGRAVAPGALLSLLFAAAWIAPRRG
jgi:predicted exporter